MFPIFKTFSLKTGPSLHHGEMAKALMKNLPQTLKEFGGKSWKSLRKPQPLES